MLDRTTYQCPIPFHPTHLDPASRTFAHFAPRPHFPGCTMPTRRICQHWQRTGPIPLQEGAQARRKLDRIPTSNKPKANYARKRWSKLADETRLIESSVEACRLTPRACPKKVRTSLNRGHKSVEYSSHTYTLKRKTEKFATYLVDPPPIDGRKSPYVTFSIYSSRCLLAAHCPRRCRSIRLIPPSLWPLSASLTSVDSAPPLLVSNLCEVYHQKAFPSQPSRRNYTSPGPACIVFCRAAK